MLRTLAGTGMVTRTSSTAGLAEEPVGLLNALPRPPMLAPGREPSAVIGPEPDFEPELVVALGLRTSLASNSSPLVPNDGRTSTVIGRLRVGVEILPGFDGDVNMSGSRLHSYPASTNRPSGGTKLSSPGVSRHRASLTQGWKQGRSIACVMPVLPPGAVRVSSRSGTPDIFAVNAIVPLAMADNGRPDGAKTTDSFSTMST